MLEAKGLSHIATVQPCPSAQSTAWKSRGAAWRWLLLKADAGSEDGTGQRGRRTSEGCIEKRQGPGVRSAAAGASLHSREP